MSITAPKSGDDAIEESSLSAGVKLVGASSIPVAGAQVVASGACSGTLSDQGNGSYTGTCTVAKYGTSGTITFTATAANTMTKTVTIDIKKRAHLTMTVEAPKAFDYTRGQSFQVKVKLASDVTPLTSDSVTAPGLTFTKSGTYWVANYTSGYATPASVSLTISASGKAGSSGQAVAATQTLAFTFSPVTLTVSAEMLANGAKTTRFKGGETPGVRLKVKYPSSAAVPAPALDGTLTVADINNDTSVHGLNFSQSGDYWVAAADYVVKKQDVSLKATVSASDGYGNSGTGYATVKGPEGGLTLVVEEPSGAAVFSPGQRVRIEVRVKSEKTGDFIVADLVKIGNVSCYWSGDACILAGYTIPATDEAQLTLPVEMREGTITDYASLSLLVSTELGGKALSATLVGTEKTLAKGDSPSFNIYYPNGDPVTNGSFTATFSGGNVSGTATLTRVGDAWLASSIDLGNAGGLVTVEVAGRDSSGNELRLALDGVRYSPTPGLTPEQVQKELSEKSAAEQQNMYFLIIGVVLLLGVVAGGVVLYVKKFGWREKFLIYYEAVKTAELSADKLQEELNYLYMKRLINLDEQHMNRLRGGLDRISKAAMDNLNAMEGSDLRLNRKAAESYEEKNAKRIHRGLAAAEVDVWRKIKSAYQKYAGNSDLFFESSEDLIKEFVVLRRRKASLEKNILN
jgi:hypothetical protein